MTTPPFTDTRKDASGLRTTYQTVQLKDGNIWLAENFNYFVNNDVCQSFEGYGDTSEKTRGNGIGLYYDWKAFATDMVPDGWHIPKVDEWTAMMNCYGGEANAYGHLVEGGSSGLNLKLAGGTYFPGDDCSQLAMQGIGFYWSDSEGDNNDYAALLNLDKNERKSDILYLKKECRFNVRLVKNK